MRPAFGSVCKALLGVVLACTSFAGMPGTASGAPSEPKVALVIGNGAYPSAGLKNPVNDATAVANKLRSLGFDVVIKTDANQREMTRAISVWGKKMTSESVGVFYYAGHGMQVHGKNFLIPVDAEIDTEASVRTESVDLDQVLDQLGSARLGLVILDACRNNPFERRFRGSVSGGLAQIDAPTGTMIAYATAPGRVAADGTGSNGLYTSELLKAMDTRGLRIEDTFKQVRVNVLKASANQQMPWESSSLTGEFFFKPDDRAPGEDAKLRQAEADQADLRAALEEERKKREADAASVQQQMEKLREEERKRRELDAASMQQQMEKLQAELRRQSAASAAAPAVEPPRVALASPASNGILPMLRQDAVNAASAIAKRGAMSGSVTTEGNELLIYQRNGPCFEQEQSLTIDAIDWASTREIPQGVTFRCKAGHDQCVEVRSGTFREGRNSCYSKSPPLDEKHRSPDGFIFATQSDRTRLVEVLKTLR